MSEKLLKKIKDENIKFVDLRFTDTKGKMQHVTFHSDLVDEDLFKDGTMLITDLLEAHTRLLPCKAYPPQPLMTMLMTSHTTPYIMLEH